MPTGVTATNQHLLLNRERLTRLRWRWVMIVSAYFMLAVGGYWWLRHAWSPAYAQRWLLITALVLARESWLLWHGLPANHRPEDDLLLPSLGYGNRLTIARGLTIALLAGFIFAPRPPGWLAWLPAIFYTITAVLDNLDGYVARITNHTTKLGEMLDMEFDVLGILTAVLLAIGYGQLPVWYLGVGLAREIFLLGHWVLRRLNKPVYELPPSADRRLIAGLQMGFLCVVLWPIFTPPVTTVAAVLFTVPMVVSFGRDWLVTSGALAVESRRYQRLRHGFKLLLEHYLPVVARLAAVGAVGALLLGETTGRVAWGAGIVMEASGWIWLLMAVTVIAVAALAFGVLGRLAALVLVAVACFDTLTAGFVWQTNGTLLTAALYVLIFGSGAWSRWRTEERVLRHRAGDPWESAPASEIDASIRPTRHLVK